LPGFVAVSLAVVLRFHLIKLYQIRNTHELAEIAFTVFCFPCSLSQMARHVYGYRYVFDGDAALDVDDYYGRPHVV